MVKESKSYIATPPGATIKEQLMDKNMTQKEFAVRMGLTEKHISKLINGDVNLTYDVANRLESVLGVPAKFWNNLEARYREKLLKIEEENQMDEDIAIAKNLPYNEMSSFGWVEKTSNSIEKVTNLRKFFEVTQLTLINDIRLNQIICRKLSITQKSDLALIAWTQKARIEARNIETSKINIDLLKQSLPSLHSLTIQDPEDFCPNLCSTLSKCGIALVFLPHLSGSYLHGATFFEKNKIVIGLTVRGKDADRFWFSFFHEIGHIILKHIDHIYDINEKDELEADKFAKDILIDEQNFSHFIQKNDFSKSSIITFANELQIDPGIVVGRLQKEKYIPYDRFNILKKKYEIKTGEHL